MEKEMIMQEFIITKEQLAKKVKSLRKERKLSQKDLEEYSNVSRRNIGYIESAQVDIKLSTLLKLCQAFDIQLVELLDFSNLE